MRATLSRSHALAMPGLCAPQKNEELQTKSWKEVIMSVLQADYLAFPITTQFGKMSKNVYRALTRYFDLSVVIGCD